MQADYIIVGQGISGSLLALALLKEGCSVMVIDDHAPNASSKVAGGIINPVTGKRLVRSWMTETLLPFAQQTYEALSAEWGVPLVQTSSILDFHYTLETKAIFEDKLAGEKEYLQAVMDETQWQTYFRFIYGVGAIAPCLLLDIGTLLERSREVLRMQNALLEERFNINDCVVGNDHVVYKEITARKVIFCDGVACIDNPYFDRLPWSKDKGEALIVSIPGLPRDHIFKQGISIIPWGEDKDLFWVGAAHDWKYTDLEPSAAFREKVTAQLDYWLKLPYEIKEHLVAQRPANMERKPFVGLHPIYNTVGILNGMGGKGCSMAPYFAHELARHLVNQSPITPDADVSRFERILSR